MTFHSYLLLLACFFILCLEWLWHLDWPHHDLPHLGAKTAHPMVHRLLKPRSPRDCPACRLSSPISAVGEPASLPVCPWCEIKSRRGAPKRMNTQDFTCPNRKCPYFGITDAQMHALVRDGKHGHAERIQTFRCQACRTTFTGWRNTPLYHLKTPSHQIAMVLAALAIGLDPSAAERVFGFRQAIITSLSVPGWRARANPARALLLPSPPPAPPGGRTAHQATLRHTGAVALAGHRPLHKDSAHAPSGSPHTQHGTPAHALPATALGP